MISSILYKLHDLEIFKSDCISTVRSILNNFGSVVDYLCHNIKIRLRDQFIQKWHEGIFQSRKCTNYRILKNIFCFGEIPN